MGDAKIAELEKKIDALTKHITRLEDVQEIRKTQHKYGYYIDKCLSIPFIPNLIHFLFLKKNSYKTGINRQLVSSRTLPTQM